MNHTAADSHSTVVFSPRYTRPVDHLAAASTMGRTARQSLMRALLMKRFIDVHILSFCALLLHVIPAQEDLLL